MLGGLQAAGVGLSPVRSRHLENPTIGNTGPQEGDGFAHALAAGDFNGDGRDDLAVGIPYDSGLLAAPVFQSGAVVVYFGDAEGTFATAAPRQLAQFGGGLESVDHFGLALCAGDFDGDGFDDLAVGAPSEAIGALDDAGAVFVYPGSAAGPFHDDFLLFTQETVGIPEGAEEGDRFGFAITSGDFDHDGFDDLVIGAPGETLNGQQAAGWVVAIPGSASGPEAAAAFGLSQFELPGEPETTDGFGLALAAGDWNGDGFDELAVGAPGEDLGAGVLHVLFGGASGPTPSGSAVLDDFLLGGFTEPGDRFGAAVAFGNLNGDSFDELLVGVPSEDLPVLGGGTLAEAGQIVIAYGHAGVPAIGLVQHLREDNLQGASEANDFFGATLAAGDFDGDAFDELVIGHPGEDAVSGAFTVVGGSGDGVDISRRRRFASAFDGVPGSPPNGFALSLAAGDFDGDGFVDLGVGAPYATVDGIEFAGSAVVLPGALFADGFESEDSVYWQSAR